MQRGRVAKLIEDFMAQGGAVTRVAEGATTVDWAEESRLRAAAKAAAAYGHKKRWGRAA